MTEHRAAKWLISGASGLFGAFFCRYLVESGETTTGTAHEAAIDVPGVGEIRVDLTAPNAADDLIAGCLSDVVVHAAGLTDVDACERNEGLALRLHAQVPEDLARQCSRHGRKFVYISSDHLWDGSKAYVGEDDQPDPVNAYARSKVEGEKRVIAANPAALIIRTNFFGPGRPWRKSLSDWMIDNLRSGKGIDAFVDSHFTPISLSFLAPAIVNLVAKNQDGIFHVAGQDRISKYEFGQKLCQKMQLSGNLVRPARISDAKLRARRPLDMSLSTEKAANVFGRRLPSIDESIDSLNL